MSMLEKVARALCWANGMDPDLTLGGDGQNFLWHEYTHEAEAAMKAVRNHWAEQSEFLFACEDIDFEITPLEDSQHGKE